MSNKEWKSGYEEGFAAGWKAAKNDLNYTNFPPVYYNPIVGAKPTGSYAGTMADTSPITYPQPLNETKTIRNLTDHTRIV